MAGTEKVAQVPVVSRFLSTKVSDAQRRNELRDRLAGETAPGKTWNELEPDQKLDLQIAHPEIKEAVRAAQEAGVKRGDLVSSFYDVVNAQREMYGAEIERLNRDLLAGKISGNDYREQAGDYGMLMARYPEELKATDPRWKNVPLTEKERAAYYKNTKEQPSTGPVANFIEDWYRVTELSQVAGAKGQMDFEMLTMRRNLLRKKYPADIVARGMKVINQHKLPAYAMAQEYMNEYQAIPKYKGWTTAQGKKADKALALIRELSGAGVPLAEAKMKVYRSDKEGYKLALQANARRNPARKKFWAEHKLLSFFYSDLIGPELEMAGIDLEEAVEEAMPTPELALAVP
jgi:hypothetical protein